MRQFTPYSMMFSAALLLFGCGDSDSEADLENSEVLCSDKIDNDSDSAKDCIDANCFVFCSEGSTDSDTGPIEADISGMPLTPATDVPRPDGAAGNLVVLDWAGFKAAVSYTFDDSQPSQIEHYDELQETGVRMTFFASSGTSGASDYDSTWTQAVTDGHEIGNHTAHHCYSGLTGCSFGSADDTVEEEIEECNAYIAEHFGQEAVWTMASPFGDGGWNDPAESYFFLNRSVSNGTIAPNEDSNPFNLPAKMAAGEETVDDLNEDLDSVYEKGEWLIYCFHSILPTSSNWYAGVDIESITGSIDHVKSFGDMWADTMANIGAYWLGQKVLTEVSPTESGEDTVWTWSLPDHFPTGKYLRVTVDGGTLTQGGRELTWSDHGYYEVSLDKGELTLTP